MEGIQNLKACLKSAKELVGTMGEVFADGKISVTDLFKLPALYSQVSALIAAGQGAMPEIKDLDAAEAQVVLGDLIELIALIASKFGLKVS